MPIDELLRCSATHERLDRCQKWKGHSGPHIRTWTLFFDPMLDALQRISTSTWSEDMIKDFARRTLDDEYSAEVLERAMRGEFWYD